MALSIAVNRIESLVERNDNISGSVKLSPHLHDDSESEDGETAVRLPHMDRRKPQGKDAREVMTDSDSDQQQKQQSLLSLTSSSSRSVNHTRTDLSTLASQHVCMSNNAPPLAGSQGCRGNQGIRAARRRFLLEKAAKLQEAIALCEAIKAKKKTIKESFKPSTPLHKGSESWKSSTSMRSSFSTSTQQEVVPQPFGHASHSVYPNPPTSLTPVAEGVHNQSYSHGRLSTAFQHQLPQLSNGSAASSAMINRTRHFPNDLTNGEYLFVKVCDLPKSTTTRDLWAAFKHEGHIAHIRLYENAQGIRDGRATIKFSPPPAKAFWECAHYPMQNVGGRKILVRVYRETPQRSTPPIHSKAKYPDTMVCCPSFSNYAPTNVSWAMYAESVDFGMMFDQKTMMTMRRVLPLGDTRIKFCINMFHKEILVEFPMHIVDPRTRIKNQTIHGGKYDRTELFQFRIPLTQLKVIHGIAGQVHKTILSFSQETPPKFFKQLDPLNSHDDKAATWCDNDAWYRQTDLVYVPNGLKKSSLTWKKTNPIIDLGRWTTYLLVFDKTKDNTPTFDLMREALHEYNIEIVPFPGFRITPRRDTPVWRMIDLPLSKQSNEGTGLEEMIRIDKPQLAFEVRYQLEVCLSQGFLNEHNLSEDFLATLLNMNIKTAQDLLEYIANHGTRVYDPVLLMQTMSWQDSLSRTKIPSYCAYVRSATVTPTTLYLQTPIAETSNRVIRQYRQYADRFLRVRFTEEKTEGRIYPTHKDTMNEVFTRVKRVLTNGIRIGDRTYEFLACGNSQFREHGAYFFAPLPNLSTKKIRKWMGSFKEIKTVALYTSRLGQCFSTTRAIHGAVAKMVEIPDIRRNGFNFTDGVGRISPFLAHLAASELGILQNAQEVPSVFQIRVGGCKGVLAVSPNSVGRQIHIRRSQYKFPATHEGLEIIRWSQYASANLNRQLVLILSALGVPDHVFAQKLQAQLSRLERAMTDETMALAILQKEIDHNQMTLTLASMVLDGFQRTGEPFLISLLQLWRAWSIKYLKEKARITIGAGALLLGCVDETAILRGHFNNTPRPLLDGSNDEKAKYIPQVFVQISSNSEGNSEVILGPMLLARNPSLHPGDVRVVCGVDVPQLHHLKDVVVLPQTGDRDVASMCSGGDLDGDDFLVIWDQDLLPTEWNHEPMDYSRPPMEQRKEDIGIDDLTTFFVTYMKNDTLPAIAKAHEAYADYLEEGVKDAKCLKLANLHSMAVDYVKTGQPAHLSSDLKPPKWPHFMEKKGKQQHQIYTSKKVLGQLYDQVERIDFLPAFTAPFDTRILQAYTLNENILQNARQIKEEYDAHMRRIMAQQEIKTEFEVWSTFVMQHSSTNNNFKYHEQIGEISMALKDQFRLICFERAGGKDFKHIGPFAAAMYEVTAREMAAAVEECHRSQMIGGQPRPLRKMTPSAMPLMSFPWLFHDILGKIAKNSASENVDTLPLQGGGTRSKTSIKSQVVKPPQPKRDRVGPATLSPDDYLTTSEGTHLHGELPELFPEPGNFYKCKEPDTAEKVPSGWNSVESAHSSVEASVERGSSTNDALIDQSSSSSLELPHRKQCHDRSQNIEVLVENGSDSATRSVGPLGGPLYSQRRIEVVESAEKETTASDNAFFGQIIGDEKAIDSKPDHVKPEGSNLRLLSDMIMDLPARSDEFGGGWSKSFNVDKGYTLQDVSSAEENAAREVQLSKNHVSDEASRTQRITKGKESNEDAIEEVGFASDSDVGSVNVALQIDDNAILLEQLRKIVGDNCTVESQERNLFTE